MKDGALKAFLFVTFQFYCVTFSVDRATYTLDTRSHSKFDWHRWVTLPECHCWGKNHTEEENWFHRASAIVSLPLDKQDSFRQMPLVIMANKLSWIHPKAQTHHGLLPTTLYEHSETDWVV